MAAPVKLKPWRGFPSINAMHALRIRINIATPNAGQGEFTMTTGASNRRHIGTVPAGSFVLALYRQISTLFNGTTPTLDIGTVASASGFATSAAIAPATVAVGEVAAGALSGFQSAETQAYIQYIATNTTAGIGDFLLRFYMNKD